jgi:phosphatidylserine decarboxylase
MMQNRKIIHQYIERSTGRVCTEALYYNKIVNFLYSTVRENSSFLFQAITSKRMSSVLGYLNYDLMLGSRLSGNIQFLKKTGIDLSECLEKPEELDSLRKIFERKICYWNCRPMEERVGAIVSPADSKVICGSLDDSSLLFVKEKFFDWTELLGLNKHEWLAKFIHGDFAIFRLTPEKYHYNHVPVSGVVVDFYTIDGSYHSCNPNAVVQLVTPYSKNKRVVTIIDTNCNGGEGIGLVAMIEVVALMIGDIKQTYSEVNYSNPIDMNIGLFLKKGCPKSLFRPGSSTVILLFQKNKIKFAQDILENQKRYDVISRFSIGFNTKLVETDVQVRSTIANRID